MNTCRKSLLVFVLTSAIVAAVTLSTRPWDGGDGSVIYSMVLAAVTFPLGLLVLVLQGRLGDTSNWVAWTTIGYMLAGFAQWTYIVVRVMPSARRTFTRMFAKMSE